MKGCQLLDLTIQLLRNGSGVWSLILSQPIDQHLECLDLCKTDSLSGWLAERNSQLVGGHAIPRHVRNAVGNQLLSISEDLDPVAVFKSQNVVG